LNTLLATQPKGSKSETGFAETLCFQLDEGRVGILSASLALFPLIAASTPAQQQTHDLRATLHLPGQPTGSAEKIAGKIVGRDEKLAN
jgi:hypothetical protein